MADELAYALITPYSLFKSRTGGIIGRLLAYAKLDFVATRMFAFSDAFVDAYAKVVAPDDCEPAMANAWRDYVNGSLRRSNRWGYLPRCMLLLFRGPNAVAHLKDDVIGPVTDQPTGATIRGTYGDFIRDDAGKVHYFEPAVLTCPDRALNDRHLKLFADFAGSDGGVLSCRPEFKQDPEVSLVMIKPDNFYQRSRRPGNIIDAFSLTGLRVVGAKLFHMTVAQGEEFYGPLKSLFDSKLQKPLAGTVHERLADVFDFPFTQEDAAVLAKHLAERNANTEFNKIVQYMTGVDPASVADPAAKARISQAKCLALLYEGPDAIAKIRNVLGSTDPAKAEPGTVRSDFGRDLMRNGAHASDSPDNAIRERRIVGLYDNQRQTCDVSQIINDYLRSRKQP